MFLFFLKNKFNVLHLKPLTAGYTPFYEVYIVYNLFCNSGFQSNIFASSQGNGKRTVMFLDTFVGLCMCWLLCFVDKIVHTARNLHMAMIPFVFPQDGRYLGVFVSVFQLFVPLGGWIFDRWNSFTLLLLNPDIHTW